MLFALLSLYIGAQCVLHLKATVKEIRSWLESYCTVLFTLCTQWVAILWPLTLGLALVGGNGKRNDWTTRACFIQSRSRSKKEKVNKKKNEWNALTKVYSYIVFIHCLCHGHVTEQWHGHGPPYHTHRCLYTVDSYKSHLAEKNRGIDKLVFCIFQHFICVNLCINYKLVKSYSKHWINYGK